MRLLKSFLPFFICVFLFFAYFPFSVSAEEEQISEESAAEEDASGLPEEDIVARGSFDNGLTWKITNEYGENGEEIFTLTVSGSGAMPDLTGPNDAPWAATVAAYSYPISRVRIEEGVTAVGDYYFAYCDKLLSADLPQSLERIGVWAFGGSALSSIDIPSGCSSIGGGAFEDCSSITNVIIPEACTGIGDYAFGGCTGLRSVTFEGDAPSSIGEHSFSGVSASAWCSCKKTGWTEYTMLQYGADQLIWKTHIYDEGSVLEEPTCTEDGVTRFTCTLCGTKTDEAVPANGHTPVIDPAVEPGVETDGLTEGSHCSVCGETIVAQEVVPKTGYVLDLSAIPEGMSVEINGTVCDVREQTVAPGNVPAFVTAFEYAESKGADRKEYYPSRMKVYRLSCDEVGRRYTAEELGAYENLLRYSGFSIRITGVSGIRMITGVRESLKKQLTETGIEGYKLIEYGTLVQWDSALNGGSLTFETPGVKHAAAYEKGKSDPVFARSGSYMFYTNVIVGFNDKQCGKELAMRPYMKLRNSKGDQIVFYGGTVSRSIGFIALQNKDSYTPGTGPYEYIWKLIRAAYGNAYAGSYKTG